MSPIVATSPIVYTNYNITCFRMFGDMESCVGPIGSLTLLMGVALVYLVWIVGRR